MSNILFDSKLHFIELKNHSDIVINKHVYIYLTNLLLNKCTNIKILDSSNHVNNYPIINHLKRLTILDCCNLSISSEILNELVYFWSSKQEGILLDNLYNIKELSLIECDSVTIIPYLKTLECLHIRECKNLKEIKGNKRLKNLYCEYCPMMFNIPNNLLELTSLDIVMCPIKNIPDTLTSLVDISLSYVLIESIPNTLVNLENLFCDRCEYLCDFPSNFSKISGMTFIDCVNMRCLDPVYNNFDIDINSTYLRRQVINNHSNIIVIL